MSLFGMMAKTYRAGKTSSEKLRKIQQERLKSLGRIVCESLPDHFPGDGGIGQECGEEDDDGDHG